MQSLVEHQAPIPLTAIPYGTAEWKCLYHERAAVEREFGGLKLEYRLASLRGISRVRKHADLVLLARLGQARSRVRTLALAA